MPIYEYRCCRCDNSFEELVLSSRETIACPSCDSPEVERQLSVFSAPGERASKGSGGCGGCSPGGCGCH